MTITDRAFYRSFMHVTAGLALNKQQQIKKLVEVAKSTYDAQVKKKTIDALFEYGPDAIDGVQEIIDSSSSTDVKLHGLEAIKRLVQKIRNRCTRFNSYSNDWLIINLAIYSSSLRTFPLSCRCTWSSCSVGRSLQTRLESGYGQTCMCCLSRCRAP